MRGGPSVRGRPAGTVAVSSAVGRLTGIHHLLSDFENLIINDTRISVYINIHGFDSRLDAG
jgi:hypothetical protein